MPRSKTQTATHPSPAKDEEPEIQVLRTGKCKTLSGSATLGYCLGLDSTSALHWRLASNSGGGFFSDEWIPFEAIQAALNGWPKDRPLTSMALQTLFTGKSANNASFLLACLVKEGLLEAIPNRRRHYRLCDSKPFLASVEELKGAHSQTGKPRAKAKAKAGRRMTKTTTTTAKAK